MEMLTAQGPGLIRALFAWIQKRILGASRHWLAYANLFWGMLSGLPWLAPILMRAGATGLAKGIYSLYSFLCHQFANRSFFLFGPRLTYSTAELLGNVTNANTLWGLRSFVGAPELGFKVAWSDRMVSLYGGILLGGVLYALLHRWLRSPRWTLLLLMVVPLFLDGGTHAISDLGGVDQGFRYNNAWLVDLTRDAFPAGFYAGNGLGSFNSSMRLATGLLAGLGVAWMLYPVLDEGFRGIGRTLGSRLARSG